jgi:phage gp46-like protein
MELRQMQEIIDRTIKEVWTEKIPYDYQSNYLLMEDSLKNALYFHLRTRLGNL